MNRAAPRAGWLALTAASAVVVFAACAESDLAASPETDAGTDAPPLDSSTQDSGAVPDDAPNAPETCSEGGFCPVPLPVKTPLLGISAASSDDAWAIGKDVVLHWDGDSWVQVYHHSEYTNDDPGATFQGVWVAGHDDVWIVGTTAVLRYSAIDATSPPTFRLTPSAGFGGAAGVSLFPTKDGLWRLGMSGIESYSDDGAGGLTMTELPLPPLEPFSIWGFAPDDIWVGGQVCPDGEECFPWMPETYRGAIAHYDGADWSVEVLDYGRRVSAITGFTATSSAHQLWVWTGFSREDALPTKSALALHAPQVDGSIGTPLFSQSLITDGTGVSDDGMSAPMWCSRIIGSIVSPNTSWFTNGCLVYRWNGTGLELVRSAIGGLPPGKVNGIWAASADDVWLVGESLPKGAKTPPSGFALRRTRADGGRQ